MKNNTDKTVGYACCIPSFSAQFQIDDAGDEMTVDKTDDKIIGNYVYLEALYVEEEYRNKGLGISLFNQICKYALNNGCSAIRWDCLGWNESSLKFYEKLGAVNLTKMNRIRMWREDFIYMLEGDKDEWAKNVV